MDVKVIPAILALTMTRSIFGADGDMRPVKAALPRFIPGDDRAVLLIHGFTGIPKHMDYLAAHLSALGFTVSIPRLPGHGTNARDFVGSGWRDWLRRATDAYAELATNYREVYLAGLSMGGVLAIILAGTFRPTRIALCAPAVQVTNKLLPFARLAAPFIKKYRIPFQPSEDDEELAYLEREYWSHDWVKPGADLYKLMTISRARLSSVVSPSLVILSEKDDVVPLSAGQLIQRRIASTSVKTVTLTESEHNVVDGSERQRVAEEIGAWFT